MPLTSTLAHSHTLARAQPNAASMAGRPRSDFQSAVKLRIKRFDISRAPRLRVLDPVADQSMCYTFEAKRVNKNWEKKQLRDENTFQSARIGEEKLRAERFEFNFEIKSSFVQ